jgi:hypothetical protein
MEQALKEFESAKTNPVAPIAEPVVETKEIVEEVKQEQVEPPKEVVQEVTKEVVEDEFGGDYSKLKKSYKEAYSWNTRMAQDLSELKKQILDIKSSNQPKQEQPVAQPTITQEQFNEWYERDPISANRFLARVEAEERVKGVQSELMNVKQSLNGILAQSSVNKYRSQYSDFAALENDIKEVVEQLPSEMAKDPQYFEKTLDIAYWTVKGKKLKESEDKAREEGRREATVKAQSKKDAFVEGSAKTTPEAQLNPETMSSEELYNFMKSKGIAP